MTDPRIIFTGAPETAADFPGINLYCTQRRVLIGCLGF
jgi:hypothetical protein